MDLKNVLIRYNILLVFFIFSSSASSSAEKTPLTPNERAGKTVSSGTSHPAYIASEGRIREVISREFQKFDIAGRVEYVHERDGIIYYLKSLSSSLFLGYINPGGVGFLYEWPLPEYLNPAGIKRFFAGQGAGFIVTADSVLYRLGINDLSLRSRKGVADALLVGGKIALVELSGGACFFNFNGSRLPLTMTGDIIIKNIADDRIVFLTNGRDVELMDLAVMKGIYQYAPGVIYMAPEGYNLVIHAVDEYNGSAQSDERDTVFYKVFVNGAEKGRTDTGPAAVNKTYRDLLDPNMHHLVRFERWTLDRARGKYNRDNNLYQPGPLYLFIPGSRVIQIHLKFNGSRYSFQKSVLMN